jgi:hypothetical protein
MFNRFNGLLEKWADRAKDELSSAPPAEVDEPATVRSVRKLRDLDAGRRVFGAELHGYVLTRVPDHELDAFEDCLGTCLPENYRAFLAEIGYGAGPYYGLLSPADTLRELDCFNIVPDAASLPFPIGTEDGERFFFGPTRGRLAVPLLDWPTTGLIPVAYQGETAWSVLVTSGVFTGTVWDVVVLDEVVAECRPALRPPTISGEGGAGNALPPLRRPPTFDQWYRGWLTRAFADFEWK